MVFNLWMFLAVGCVCLLGVLVAVLTFAHREKAKQLDLQKEEIASREVSTELEAVMRQEIDALTERVETLEAIVTDERYDLGQKIEQVR